jgi:hypothetical protein
LDSCQTILGPISVWDFFTGLTELSLLVADGAAGAEALGKYGEHPVFLIEPN